MKVIIDTNFLLIPGTLGVDIFSKIREMNPSNKLYIIDKSIDELEKIKKEQKKFKKAADLAIQLIDNQKINIIKTEKVKNVDEIIVEKAAEGYVVATQDKILKKTLEDKKIPVILLKQKKYLVIEKNVL